MSSKLKPAVGYIRMSTDRQENKGVGLWIHSKSFHLGFSAVVELRL